MNPGTLDGLKRRFKMPRAENRKPAPVAVDGRQLRNLVVSPFPNGSPIGRRESSRPLLAEELSGRHSCVWILGGV